ncbi:hypothetical protein LTR16_000856 [Cryomyces antarcticus]|uniref:Protein kinase domain-containing protein n=1 Tax=Cryomyces antarcticus TaxID=329879 RepID=A0ABR0LZV4_9PEZI|nr:hypothetical protein LTR16_000856 [Cryomyces antarcticus]
MPHNGQPLSCNNKRFQILLSPGPSPYVTIEGSLLKQLDAAMESQDEIEMEIIQEEIADVVCEACQPVFQQLAPLVEGGSGQMNLQSFLNPETFLLQLVTMDGKAKIIRREGVQATTTSQYGLKTIDKSLPRIYSREIQVLEQFVRKTIMKVLVDGQERCCKIGDDLTRGAVQRELVSLKEISDAGLAYSIRVPKLLGLIRSKSNEVIRILEDYIQPSLEASNLRQFNIETIAKSRRRKWASQIQESVLMLHMIGVVWGDGKAENVLIDVYDDAWIIDFGGSWTDGWVDKELAGTIQGDKQALNKITQFLLVE